MDINALRLFVQERLRAYDPDVKLDTGSPASVNVVEPIVRRFQPDPLEPNIKKFCLARLRQEFPQLYAKEGAALADALVKPAQVLFEPFRREIRSVKRQKSLGDPSTLTSEEADSLMDNVFIRRKAGDFARVKVRIYFPNPLSVSIGSTNFAFTASNLRFIPTEPQSITSEAMLFNTDGDLYYFDVSYVAEAPGARYNIGASEIIGVTSLTSATRATNLARAEFGIDEETTIQVISRGEKSIGERSLTTVPGAVAALFDQFSELQILQVIGFMDPEMQRDVITGGGRGPILYQGNDGETPDDGAVGAYTSWFDSASGSFTSNLGPVGTDISGYELMVYVGGQLREFTLGEVLGATRISISGEYTGTDQLPEGESSVIWAIRQRETLTLSGIPGGILFPDELATEITIPNNQVHVGGCADMLVKGQTIEEKSLAIPAVADQQTIARGFEATFNAGSDLVVLNDLSADDYEDIEVGQAAIYVKAGAPADNLGVYRIVDKYSTLGVHSVRIQADESLLVNGIDYTYEIVDDIDIDLTGPKEIKYEGSDLQTFAGSNVVSTVSGLPDFTSAGVDVQDGDVVEIINGDDRGTYVVDVGGVAPSQLTLDVSMVQTDGPLQYRIYRLEESIVLPLLRVKTVEMLDSDRKPLGSFVPYKNAVDGRSNSFQNPGRGAKAGTSVDPDDLLARSASPNEDVVSSSEVTNFYDVGVRIGDIVNISTSDNRGFYTVVGVGGQAAGLSNNELQLDSQLSWPASDMEYDVGAPSYGSFRLYFLDPVTYQVTYDETYISVELSNGSSIRFRPDPDVRREYLPTEVDIPTAEMSTLHDRVSMWAPGAGTGAEISYYTHQVQPGDRVRVTYAPIVGALDLTSTSLNLDGKTLLIDLGAGYETVTFSGTSLNLSTIVSQINSQLSEAVASKYVRTAAPAGEYLMLRRDGEVTLRGDGTATADIFDDPGAGGNSRAVFMPWYTTGEFADASSTYETENDSHVQGTYLVDSTWPPDDNSLKLTETDGTTPFATGYDIEAELGHYLHLERNGSQRISSTDMADQGTDDLGFYYFDIECISEGYGDQYNIGEDQKATVSGAYSEGWDISVDDENLSYSMAEIPTLSVSPRILVEGVTDDPSNYTELVATNLQVDYDRMPLVQYVHSYVMEKANRVVCESPLARALFPTFVRTFIEYYGGSTESDVREELASVIEQTVPEEDLEVSDLHDTVRRLGSNKVTLPIVLVGIEHKADRSIDVSRSEDAITTDRLSAMIPDDDGTTTEGASYILLDRIVS